MWVLFIVILLICIVTKSIGTICPRGTYLPTATSRSCTKCHAGKYGITAGLTACAGVCPAGKYGQLSGAISEDDCTLCPPGTYGQISGLSSEKCTASCPPGRYSTLPGQTSLAACNFCPVGYFEGQCAANPATRNMIVPRQHRED